MATAEGLVPEEGASVVGGESCGSRRDCLSGCAARGVVALENDGGIVGT